MYTSIIAFAVLALAAAAQQGLRCNYPYFVYNTSPHHAPFFLTVLPARYVPTPWSGHNVQLRDNGKGLLLAVVDNIGSPVLRGRMTDGVVQQFDLSERSLRPEATGYVLGYNQVSSLDNGNLRRYELAFAKNGVGTNNPAEFNKTTKFYFDSGLAGNGGFYNLDLSPNATSYGFAVCPVDSSTGKFYQLYFISTRGNAALPRGCYGYSYISTFLAPSVHH